MVLGKLPVLGRPAVWMIVGPVVLAVGTVGGCLDFFTLLCPVSSLSPSLWKTARYRLKYCLKGPLNPQQPSNQPKKFLLSLCLYFIFICFLHFLILAKTLKILNRSINGKYRS